MASTQDGMVANGDTQATATPIVACWVRFVKVPTDGSGARLPAATAGKSVVVVNDDPDNNTLHLFPSPDDAIDGGSVNGAIVVCAGRLVQLFAIANGQWWSTLARRKQPACVASRLGA